MLSLVVRSMFTNIPEKIDHLWSLIPFFKERRERFEQKVVSQWKSHIKLYLKCLRRSIKSKCRDMLIIGICLLHYNVHHHVAFRAKTLLKKFKEKVSIHSPYSPDFASNDFHLFLYLKRHLARKYFHGHNEIKICFQQLAKNLYDNGIQKSVPKLNIYLGNGGNFIEK